MTGHLFQARFGSVAMDEERLSSQVRRPQAKHGFGPRSEGDPFAVDRIEPILPSVDEDAQPP